MADGLVLDAVTAFDRHPRGGHRVNGPPEQAPDLETIGPDWLSSRNAGEALPLP